MGMGQRQFGALLCAGFVLVGTPALTVLPSYAASPAPTPPPSAIGQHQVTGIAVSPAYERTGFVAVAATPSSGSKNPNGDLWISHDGGASWEQKVASGWSGAVPVIAADGQGRETLFASSGAGLQLSGDYGASWSTVAGASYHATVSPQFASDGSVAVTAAHDYVWSNGRIHPITGSGRDSSDYAFTYSPSFPSGGLH